MSNYIKFMVAYGLSMIACLGLNKMFGLTLVETLVTLNIMTTVLGFTIIFAED